MKVTLPYTDTKPQGAADFYFGINATFRFVKERFGYEGLLKYWQDMGREYFRPVSAIWKEGGWPAVAGYWRAFFAAEPGAEVEVEEGEEGVVLKVKRCPAIAHLRAGQREIMSEFCEHCHFMSDAIGESAGIAARVAGGNGSCEQRFSSRSGAMAQDLREIRRCSC